MHQDFILIARVILCGNMKMHLFVLMLTDIGLFSGLCLSDNSVSIVVQGILRTCFISFRGCVCVGDCMDHTAVYV